VSFFLGDFIFWTSKKEVPRRYKAKPKVEKDNDINYWILAFASMTRRWDWMLVPCSSQGQASPA